MLADSRSIYSTDECTGIFNEIQSNHTKNDEKGAKPSPESQSNSFLGSVNFPSDKYRTGLYGGFFADFNYKVKIGSFDDILEHAPKSRKWFSQPGNRLGLFVIPITVPLEFMASIDAVEKGKMTLGGKYGQ